MLLHLMFEVLW